MPLSAQPERLELRVGGAGPRLAGEALGEGPAIVLAHGITATRRYLLYGSKVLPKAGYRVISYDARGHGESEPGPREERYDYRELAYDLGRVITGVAGSEPPVLVGHSMGTHTVARFALAAPQLVRAAVFVGPVSIGELPGQATLDAWDLLADGLEGAGVDGFVDAFDHDLDPAWRDTQIRIARERMALHRHPAEVARAMREVPRSLPFEGLARLESIEVPALVVASHDAADPGHPYEVAERWTERLPNARMVSEEPGASPLAWQGGRLSREIIKFLNGPEAAGRR